MFLKPPRRAQLILCVGIVVGLAVSLLLLRTAHTAPASLRLSALAATPRTRHLSRGALCHGGAPVLPPDALQQEDEEALLSALSSVQRARTQPPSDALPHVLILTPVKNAAKHLPRYFANLASLDYPAASISLGIMDSDSADSVDPADEAAVRALTKTDAEVAQLLHGGSSKSGTWMRLLRELPALRERYRSVTLFQHDYGMRLAREDRHTPSVQLARRIIMAKSRNQLLQLCLCDEEWVLWLDSDLISFPPGACLLHARVRRAQRACLRCR
ncbi:hypothetical protein EON67_03925 [archaeon]|nr:MAG: hypothetical protein EON67_03925 [archaeon]